MERPQDEKNVIANPDLKMQIEAENRNFDVTTKMLGNSTDLVQDFQELYKSLAAFVVVPDGGAATEGAKVTMLALHFLMKSRGNLLIGVLALLRGYRGNSLLYLRGAIEACAFAAHIRRKPELVDVWLNAADDSHAYKTYKTYKGHFKALFPKDDSLLQQLYERYDRCSQVIHSSLYSMAGHFSYSDDDEGMGVRFNLFDIQGDHSIVSNFFFALDTHRRILKRFAETLSGEIKPNANVWELRFNSVEAKVNVHREKWKTGVPNPVRPTL
jgi:hypothetical protein